MDPRPVTFILLLTLISCLQACGQVEKHVEPDSLLKKIEAYYEANKGDSLPSRSIGSTGKGRLEHGKLMPFSGKNFRYFDAAGYLAGRAYLNGKVKDALLEFYRLLEPLQPGRTFYIMECSPKNGGYFFPHNTHQNGLSVDLMIPMLKDGKPYTGLDSMGIPHYWISFDNNGRYEKDSSVSIDFELLAMQVLVLEKAARSKGLRIIKVILKMELKDELYSGTYGKKLKKNGIYFARILPDNINKSHDEHIHVDFEVIK